MTGRGAGSDDQPDEAAAILTSTFATMELLRRAVAAELGEDDADSYGLGSPTVRRAVSATPAE